MKGCVKRVQRGRGGQNSLTFCGHHLRMEKKDSHLQIHIIKVLDRPITPMNNYTDGGGGGGGRRPGERKKGCSIL